MDPPQRKDLPFNPIKVLFLRRSNLKDFWRPYSFNPIKVLFLQGSVSTNSSTNNNFQSYQGSIFTLYL